MKHFYLSIIFFCYFTAQSQNIQVSIDRTQTYQVIDGFGAHQGDGNVNTAWWLDLFYNDAGASIYRVDLTPRLKSPISSFSYYSPWFMGSGTKHVLNLEDTANPNGPENNRVRTYNGPTDYSRSFGGYHAPIAVMGPDINQNIQQFTYTKNDAITQGHAMKATLGDFKLIGSLWSPVPWVKIASGNDYSQDWWPGPVAGSPWPFIWGGNFAGGKLDVSDTPLDVFDDAALGGSGPTSSLTQFARSSAAYISGYQKFHGVQFYAISIQNELNFEQFYNSMTYPLSSQYIKAVTAMRREFDKYEDLKNIKIMGPEDLLGGDAYGMWEYGSHNGPIHKNLQLIQNIETNAEAAKAVDFYCIHGYADDGVSSSGANPYEWKWWTDGWQNSPAPGIPSNVQGINAFKKKSWMTETSGENAAWLFPTSGYPNNGGFSIATKIHQAMTIGNESAWIYWTFTESDANGQVTNSALSNLAFHNKAPKYVAAKHFYKFIRPNAYRIDAISNDNNLLTSAYHHAADNTMTVVLINTSSTAMQPTVLLAKLNKTDHIANQYTSSHNSYWQENTTVFSNNAATIAIPSYGVVTLYIKNVLTTSTPEIAHTITDFSIHPNPVSDDLHINYTLSSKQNVAIRLLDLSGRAVYHQAPSLQLSGHHHTTISSDGLANGIYICEIKGEQYLVSKKVKVVR